MRCPSCKKTNALRSWKGSIKVMGVDVTTDGRRCNACGELVFDQKTMEEQEVAAANILVARGIRTGTEFKFVRKVAGLRASELAEMLAIRPETVSRWERGEIDIPRPVAFVLGELYERPKVTRRKLEAFAHRPAAPPRT